MHTLIEDLLLLARADEQTLLRRREQVALDDLAQAEVDRARRDTQCVIHTDIHPVRLEADPVAMSRMIRNLIENAVRHADSCAAIEVGGQDATVTLTVSDDGPGIAPADRRRVFERFVRLDSDRARSGGGAGLGLAIVAEIVAAHNGVVTIDDPPCGGTTMIVTLPVSQHTSR
jgi:signal transduction histidine kinase